MSAPLSVSMALAALAWSKMRNEGASLERAIAQVCARSQSEERAAAQSIVYTATRHWAKLDIVFPKLVHREPTPEVRCLLEVALALLLSEKEHAFTVVDQCVRAAKANPKTTFASGFVNAVLRNFLRSKAQLTAGFATNLSTRFNAPGWWVSKLRKAYPKTWQSILTTQTLPPPLTLRVNQRKTTQAQYLELLHSKNIDAYAVDEFGVVLKTPRPVNEIPGFDEGLVSVQDAGSQWVPTLLQAENGQKILDACCAPGGKTAHILESVDAQVTAVEIDPERAKRIESTLARLNLKADIVVADANNTKALSARGPFDAIVLDAPCTASGIVRRHPDIPWLRRPNDIENLARQQARLLRSMWSILPKGKKLLYIVCSVFPEEGPMQIEKFLNEHSDDAQLIKLCDDNGGVLRLVPTEKVLDESRMDVHDGFFYALLMKV